MKYMKKCFFALVIASSMFLLSSCGNDGIHNEETNREAIEKKQEVKDSIPNIQLDKVNTDFDEDAGKTIWQIMLRKVHIEKFFELF
jgi:hypothetical protein